MKNVLWLIVLVFVFVSSAQAKFFDFDFRHNHRPKHSIHHYKHPLAKLVKAKKAKSEKFKKDKKDKKDKKPKKPKNGHGNGGGGGGTTTPNTCESASFNTWEELIASEFVSFFDDLYGLTIESECSITLNANFSFNTAKVVIFAVKDLVLKENVSINSARLILYGFETLETAATSSFCGEIVVLESPNVIHSGSVCESSMKLGTPFNAPSAMGVMEAVVYSSEAPTEVYFNWGDSFGVYEDVIVDISNGQTAQNSGDGVSVYFDQGGSYTAQGRLQTPGGEALTNEVAFSLTNPYVNLPQIAVIETDRTTASTSETITLSANGSSDPEGDELFYEWSLPNGITSFNREVNFEILEAIEYVIGLRVYDSYGNNNYTEIVITGKEPLVNSMTITKSSESVPATINLSPNILVDEEGRPLSFQWYVNSVFVSSEQSPSIEILDPGNTYIKLVTIDNAGVISRTEEVVTLETHPLYFSLSKYEIVAAVGEELALSLGGLALSSNDYQVTLVPNLLGVQIVQDLENNSFKISPPVNFVGKFEIVATAQSASSEFVRKVSIEYVELNTVFDEVLGGGVEQKIRYNDEDLITVQLNEETHLKVRLGATEAGEILLRINSEEEGSPEIYINQFNADYEYIQRNTKSHALASSDNHGDISLGFLSEGEIRRCLPNNGTLNDSVDLALRKKVSIPKDDPVFISDPNYPDILFHEKRKDLYIKQYGQTQLNTGSPEIAKLLKALSLNPYNVYAPIYLLSDSEMKYLTDDEEADGVVYTGSERIYLNIEMLKPGKNLEHYPFLVLAHESHHIAQNRSCSYQKSLLAFNEKSAEILTESHADLYALKKLIALPDGSYTDLVNYNDLRGSTGGISKDFFDLISKQGFLYNSEDALEEYKNEVFFDLLGIGEYEYAATIAGQASSFFKINILENYLPAGANYKDLVSAYLRNLTENSGWEKLGFDYKEAAQEVELNQTIPLGPYGFGYYKVTKEIINQGLLYGNKFRLKVQKNDDVEITPIVGSLVGLDGVVETHEHKIYEFSVLSDGSNDFAPNVSSAKEDAYIAIINKSSSEESITVDKIICLDDKEKLSSVTRQCIWCDTEFNEPNSNIFIWTESLGVCTECAKGGTIRADGTCDWPPPEIKILSKNVELTGYFAGEVCPQHESHPWSYYLGRDQCTFEIECKVGDIRTSLEPYILPSWDYYCQLTSEGYVVYQYAIQAEDTVTCLNQEGDPASITVTCP